MWNSVVRVNESSYDLPESKGEIFLKHLLIQNNDISVTRLLDVFEQQSL